MQQDKYYWNNTGSVTVAEGHAGKIYVVVNETSNDTYYTDDAYNFTIGEPKYTFNINVATNNASLGTVSKNKSSVTEGGSVTLTANETSGTFQGWSLDGGTTIIAGTNNQLTYSPTLGADAGSNGQTFTYTAVFVPKNAPQYTITTAVSPSNTYGTVTGAGSYYENNPATLTATSANEHLYIFDHWLKDGNNYAGGATITPTVTAAATYTAVFRAAAAGTITGVADHGTISGTGNYAGGTAVQLGVTAADGYVFTQWSDGNTDNPRTVYVDGNATYTAQFVEGVEIYDEEGVFEIGTSHTGYFTIRGDGNGYHAELNYNATILDGVHTYTYAQLDNSTDWSWIKPDGGSKVAITNAETTIDYYGLNYRAAHLVSKVTCANGKVYMVEIYTNQGTECGGFIESSSMGFRDDGYGGWNLASSPIVTPLHFSGPSEQNTGETGGILLKWSSYRGDPYYETINLALDFVLEPGATSIPSGRYPINGTRKPGTVFIGGMNANQFFSSYAEYDLGQMFSSRYNNWVYRRGYVDVINKGDGTYYIDCKGLSDSGAELYFTSGTMPVISTYALSWDANGGELSGTYTAAGSVNEGTSITAPTATRTGYTFNGWSPEFTGYMPAANTTYVAQWTPQTYDITYKDQGDVTYTGANLASLPATHTYGTATDLVAGVKEGYTFGGWYDNAECTGEAVTTIAANSITAGKTLYAKWTATVTTHTITLSNGANGTITVHNEDTDADVVFTDNTATVQEGTTLSISATGNTYKYGLFTLEVNGNAFASGNTLSLTEDITIEATYGVILWDNKDNDYYDDFNKTHHKHTENAIYNRQFVQGRWATLCLPFNVNNGTLRTMSMLGRVYEFSKATGSATIIEGQNNGITLYFSNATSLVAGKCYIVNANASLAKKTSFMFSNVYINLTADSVADLTVTNAFDNLGGYKQSGDIELVGTLRKGTLIGTGTGNTYMGLKDNMIYYPNSDQGNIILAYRGLFRSSTALNAERIRIIVDGEEKAELEVINGELQDVQETKKFIENGVLYIERNGIIYDATGRKVE